MVGFSTSLGIAIIGSCENVFSRLDVPIALSIMSPPFPVAKGRDYGTFGLDSYVDFLTRSIEPMVRSMAQGASVMLHLGDVFERGLCARSLYQEETLIALRRRLGLYLVDKYAWVQKNRAPGPVKYASIDRVMLNSGWDAIYHLTNDPARLRCSNLRVLEEHTTRHLQLIARGGERRHAVSADGAHRIRPGAFANPTPGRIPRNVLTFSHTCASQRQYKAMARACGLKPHGAAMPLALAEFLVEYGSAPGDIVADCFGGSETTALAAQRLGRRWITTEKCVEYVLGGGLRFQTYPDFCMPLAA